MQATYETWRGESTDEARRVARRVRRGLITMLVLVGVGLLLYVVFRPAFHPNTHLIVITGQGHDTLGVPLSPYCTQSVAGFEALQPALFQADANPQPRVSRALRSRLNLDRLWDELTDVASGSRDVMIFYVTAPTIVYDDEPSLICDNFSAESPAAGLYKISDLLDHLAAMPAHVKLLILESQTVNYDPRLGVLQGDFATHLDRVVRSNTVNDSLWVLHAHAVGERSHSDHTGKLPLFTQAVQQGLLGAADKNADQVIDIHELHTYVERHVAYRVDEYSSGRESQRPLLQRTGGESESVGYSPPLLSLRPLVTAEEEAAKPEAAPPTAARVTLPLARTVGWFQAGIPPREDSAGKPSDDAADESTPDIAPDETTGESAIEPAPLSIFPARAALDEQLVAMWQVRDQLESRSQLRVSPIDVAPHLWRQAVARLQRVEDLRLAGMHDEATNESRKLYRSLAPLAALLDPSVSPPQTSDKLGAQIAEQLAQDTWSTIPSTPPGLAPFAEEGTREALTKWLATVANEDLQGAARMVSQLATRPDIPWTTIQQALRTRLASERLDTIDAPLLRWVREDVEVADRLRVHAERELFKPIDTTPEAVLLKLQRAEVQYNAIAERMDVAEIATANFRDLCQRLPVYIRMYRSVATSTNELQILKQLHQLTDHLTKLGSMLREAEPQKLGTLPRLLEKMRKTQTVIEMPISAEHVVALTEAPDDPATAWWVHQLLATPLLSADSRQRLNEIRERAESALHLYLDGAETVLFEGATTVASPESIRQRDLLEGKVAMLAAANLAGSQSAAEGVNSAAVSTEGESLATKVEVFYRDLPDTINDVATSYRDLSDPATRPGRLAVLRTARSVLRFVDARDAGVVTEPLHRQLRDASRYDLLAWQIHRARQAMAFAWPDEIANLQAGIASRQQLAETLSDQPVVAATRPAAIEVQGPHRIELIDQTSAEIALQIRNRSTEPISLWAACAFDDRVCSVSARTQQVLYRDQHGLPRGRRGGQELEPTLTIPAGATRPLNLRVARPEKVTGQTHVLVKLVSADPDQSLSDLFFHAADGAPLANVARSDGRSTRDRLLHAVDVAMPFAPTVDVDVTGAAGTWSRQADGFTLHPFPNRATEYQLSLTNDVDTEQRIDVRLVATRQEIALPLITLDAEAAKRFESEFLASAETLVEMAELKLAPEQTVPVPFPDLEAAEGEEKSGLLPADVTRDLLLIVASRESGTTTLHRLKFAPQRPRRYVRAIVSYDALAERLHIRVLPIDDQLLPAGGINVRARFETPLDAGTQKKLAGKIMSGDDEARMYADLARAAAPQTLYLDVDGYPRAFIYDIHPQTARDRIAEATTRAALRITMPAARTAFAAPTTSIPVEFAIDAPVGSFHNNNDFAEIGIDADLDGEFRGESPIRLVSDRQSEIAIIRLGSLGTLTVRASVGDFRMNVPVDGIQNAHVNVLGAVNASSQQVLSKPVKIHLDARPPTISLVTPTAGRTVTVGSPLGLEIGVTDQQGAGVSKVEVALDVNGKGEFVEESAPVEAKPATGGVWTADVDTSVAPAGTYALLVRATDSVGNQSDYTVIKGIRIVTATEAEQMAADKTSRVFGQARYGSEPAAGVSMTLQGGDPQADPIPTVTTDDSGQFVFPAVPAGEYQLTAEGTIRNNPVTIKLPRGVETFDVTVAPPRDVELSEVSVR